MKNYKIRKLRHGQPLAVESNLFLTTTTSKQRKISPLQAILWMELVESNKQPFEPCRRGIFT